MRQPDEMRAARVTRNLCEVGRNTVSRPVSCPSESDILEFVNYIVILSVIARIQNDVSRNVFLSEVCDYARAELRARARDYLRMRNYAHLVNRPANV